MGALSPLHWIAIIVVILLLFGPKRFADAAKGLGQALRGFKEELSKGDEPPQTGADAAKRLPAHEPGSGTPANEGKREA